jgi:pimeloyl-ACP methyl ester carboxylesterase
MPSPRHFLPSSVRPATLGSAARAGSEYGASDRPDWREVRWREHLRAVTVDGRRVHAVSIGAGTGLPVLFVHGLGGRWQNWLENIPRLAARRRVVAIDLPGFGRSQMPREAISMAGYATVADRVCDLFELDRVALVASSMGGFIAAELALHHPQRLERIALVSPVAAWMGDFDPGPATALLAALARTRLGTPAGIRAIIARPRSRHLAFATLVRHPTRIAPDILLELAGGQGAAGFGGALAAMLSHDLRDQLAEVAVPTLIVHGREDMIVPLADSVRLGQTLPSAQLEIFEDTGHLAMVERPRRFNDALERFLDA